MISKNRKRLSKGLKKKVPPSSTEIFFWYFPGSIVKISCIKLHYLLKSHNGLSIVLCFRDYRYIFIISKLKKSRTIIILQFLIFFWKIGRHIEFIISFLIHLDIGLLISDLENPILTIFRPLCIFLCKIGLQNQRLWKPVISNVEWR